MTYARQQQASLLAELERREERLRHDEHVGNCVVFSIGGNKYRLVTRILYPSRKVFILKVMTHKEYDVNNWQAELRLLSSAPEGPDVAKSQAKETQRKGWLLMATKTGFAITGKSRDLYLEIGLAFPLASIKSDKHLAAAQEVLDRLLAESKMNHGEETYLEALSDLVAAYEDEHHAIEPASDSEILRHLMEVKGIAQTQLSQDSGVPKSSISEVLAGRKLFSRQMIRKLAEYFKVPIGVLAANI